MAAHLSPVSRECQRVVGRRVIDEHDLEATRLGGLGVDADQRSRKVAGCVEHRDDDAYVDDLIPLP